MMFFKSLAGARSGVWSTQQRGGEGQRDLFKLFIFMYVDFSDLPTNQLDMMFVRAAKRKHGAEFPDSLGRSTYPKRQPEETM